MENFKLNDGHEIPAVGFGVYMMTPEECEPSVIEALKAGYRHIDTANAYMNERAVGRAVKKSGLSRDEIFITTKLWPSDYGYEKTKKAIDATLARLDISYIDLLLLHQQYGDYIGAWKAMEEYVGAGKVRSIGISNFNLTRLQDLISHAKIVPAAAQVECHPYYQETELREFLKKYGTVIESWYPIGHGDRKLIGEEAFARLGEKYQKSPVQIILKWHVQEGFIVLPKSTNPAHIANNIDLFDFTLTDSEMQQIRALDKKERYFNLSEKEQEKNFLGWKPNFDAQK